MYHNTHLFKMYNSLVFSIFTELHDSHYKNIFITTKSPDPLAFTPWTLSLQPLETSDILLLSMNLPILETSYKWNHTVYGFV